MHKLNYLKPKREKGRLTFKKLQAVASEGEAAWLLLVSDAARVPASQLGLRPDADLTLVRFLDNGVELSAWNGVGFANNQSWHPDVIFQRKRARSLKGYHVSVAIFHVRFNSLNEKIYSKIRTRLLSASATTATKASQAAGLSTSGISSNISFNFRKHIWVLTIFQFTFQAACLSAVVVTDVCDMYVLLLNSHIAELKKSDIAFPVILND